MNAINDDDFPRAFREIDIRNVNCRVEYERRKRFGFVYADFRGEIGGAVADARQEQKVRMAKHERNKVVKERRMARWREEMAQPKMDNVIPMLLRRQAE